MKEKIKEQILNLTKQYYNEAAKEKPDFKEGDRITYAARVFDEKEMLNLIDSSLEFWLTSGRYSEKFEKEFAQFLKIKHCALVNSGSSANLLAFMALTSPLLKERQIVRGDEIITVACGFPTTVSPIIQFGAVPVFVDVTLPEYNIDVNMLSAALSNKTKAVMVAHSLGNPFNLKAVKDFCVKNNLWLIEDNCDALGSTYTLDKKVYFTGTVGDLGTSSFYPPHHMTMGEGGAVYTNNSLLYRIVVSMRDWGRDCVCPSGKDNVCTHRFDNQYGQLPLGYDHKYVYSHFGYNLKATDLQASIGCAQLEKLPEFIEKRRANWQYLYNGLKYLDNELILPVAEENSNPSWFGFMMTCKNKDVKNKLVGFLEKNNIQTRALFSGNLIKHPCFGTVASENYRIVGELKNTDKIMNDTFWVGVYPGMLPIMLDHIINTISKFFKENAL